jgi:hypothetical protein
MRDQVAAHFNRYLGAGAVIWQNTEKDKTPIDIAHFPPNSKRSFHTFATLGLSDVVLPQLDGLEQYRRQEFIMYLPGNWTIDLANPESPSAWCLMRMYFAARYSEEKHPLSPGEVLHTEAEEDGMFGKFPYFLIIPPLGEVPQFFPATFGKETVGFNLPLLITENEAQFCKQHGMKELMDRMFKVHDLGILLVEPWRLDTFESDAPKGRPQPAPVQKRPNATARRQLRERNEAAKDSENTQTELNVVGCLASGLLFLAIFIFVASDYYNTTAKSFSRGAAMSVAVVLCIVVFFALKRVLTKRND